MSIDYAKFEGHTKDVEIRKSEDWELNGEPLYELSTMRRDGVLLKPDAELYAAAPALLAENKALRNTLIDILEPSHEWYEIQESTGLNEARCKEIAELYKNIQGVRG